MAFVSSLVCAVAIVAHDSGYVTSLANHIARWLRGEGIAAQVSPPAALSRTLASGRIAFLVGFERPSQGELAAIRAFRSRGGKLVVFHSADPSLASLMGVKPVGYAAAPYPGAWSRMCFDKSAPDGCPRAILQTSTVLQRAVPVAGRGMVLARWHDRSGKATGEAAWIQTDAGWWMTNVLLADGDESLKARMLASFCGVADRSLWNATASRERAGRRRAELEAYASRQQPRQGEIHAVWEHSGCGLYPGDWQRTMALLRTSHVTDLFVNVAGAGFAHYPSTVLPRSKTCEREGDQLARALVAAKGSGVRVHAWILCFTSTRSDPSVVKSFGAGGWLARDSKGRQTEYLNPAIPQVRSRILSAIDELQRQYPSLAGIHLDFVRYDNRCARPRNAADVISAFVADARRHVKRPRWLTAAVLGKYPTCVASVGQDWVGWLDSQLVDYVVPMDYSDSASVFESYVVQHASSRTCARRTIAGIGVTANESRLDARQVIDQINISRRYGLAGNALFDLDTTLEKDILPYLRQGVW